MFYIRREAEISTSNTLEFKCLKGDWGTGCLRIVHRSRSRIKSRKPAATREVEFE